jgi:hypothetical protein
MAGLTLLPFGSDLDNLPRRDQSTLENGPSPRHEYLPLSELWFRQLRLCAALIFK